MVYQFSSYDTRLGQNEVVVTKKITRAVARIKQGRQNILELGNLDAKRDWGHAKDYVEAMWLMLQKEEPEDYVIATGETHTVREFVELAFEEVGISIEWKGKGEDEIGMNSETGDEIIKINPRYYRPAEVEVLLGDPSKAEKELGWERKISFKELVSGMVSYDLKYDDFGGIE